MQKPPRASVAPVAKKEARVAGGTAGNSIDPFGPQTCTEKLPAVELEEIQERLESRLVGGELGLAEASRIIEDTGGRKPTSILQALGYRIEWHGIDFRSAKIHKKAKL